MNVPAEPVTVPVELLPSPQLIVAVKSPAAAEVKPSVNVATVPLKVSLAVAAMVVPTAVSVSASETVADVVALAVTAGTDCVSATWTLIVKLPSSP